MHLRQAAGRARRGQEQNEAGPGDRTQEELQAQVEELQKEIRRISGAYEDRLRAANAVSIEHHDEVLYERDNLRERVQEFLKQIADLKAEKDDAKGDAKDHAKDEDNAHQASELQTSDVPAPAAPQGLSQKERKRMIIEQLEQEKARLMENLERKTSRNKDKLAENKAMQKLLHEHQARERAPRSLRSRRAAPDDNTGSSVDQPVEQPEPLAALSTEVFPSLLSDHPTQRAAPDHAPATIAYSNVANSNAPVLTFVKFH